MKKLLTYILLLIPYTLLHSQNFVVQGRDSFAFAPTIQSFTVPAGISQISVTAIGGAGGNTFHGTGGGGATMQGLINVTPGDVLDIVTGGAGSDKAISTGPNGGGGGGGTFIWDVTTNTLLEVAGGGGGADFQHNGYNASATTSPNPSFLGGVSESGGQLTRQQNIPSGGGGAGYLGNGTTVESNHSIIAYGGADRASGFAGGKNAIYPSFQGGFGGGGAPGIDGGGGGGGYNGGSNGIADTTGASGGGSYINGTTISAISSLTTGNGYVIIGYSGLTYTNVTCNGRRDGSASIVASGGNSPYTYLWSDGETTSGIFGLTAGTYSVTIHDATHATSTYSCTISQPSFLAITSEAYFQYDSSNYSSLQQWKVPAGVTSITITAAGGGSYSNGSLNANGAIVTGVVTVIPGDTLYIVPGGAGSTYQQLSAGGGGTFVWDNQHPSSPLVVAGGAGGNGGGTADLPGNGQTNIANLNASTQDAAHTSVPGGNNGGGGYSVLTWAQYEILQDPLNAPYWITVSATIYSSGSGGAGWSAAGGNGYWNIGSVNNPVNAVILGGVDPLHGAAGGYWRSGLASSLTGGYGGGGGTMDANDILNVTSGGGGGGYNGGGSGFTQTGGSGGGGGSFCGGNVLSTSLNPYGSGYVLITYPGVNSTYIDYTKCYGALSDTISVPVVGGIAPYSYLWSPGGATTNPVSNLSQGTYTINIYDAGCFGLSGTVVVTNPPSQVAVISVSVAITQPYCNSGTGSAAATTTTGVPPFFYYWSNGTTNSSVNNLSAGTYTLEVGDDYGDCTNKIITISGTEGLSVSASSTPLLCTRYEGAQASVSGGAAPYTYSWSTGATTSSVSNLNQGVYSVKVSDANSCSTTAYVTIINQGELSINTPVNFPYVDSVQAWTVPAGVTTISITAMGGSGGGSSYYPLVGGYGATTEGQISVTPGHVLDIVTGGAGGDGYFNGGGGGGGTFVWDATSNTLLMVAGGGGGATGRVPLNGHNASTTTSANPSTYGGTGEGGGTLGGTSDQQAGGGGAGYLGNGDNNYGTYDAIGGSDKASGFAGGSSNAYFNASGGYGGGGGGGQYGGGGGGGYNGGGSGDYSSSNSGEGGGSYINGSTLIATSTNSGNGSVKILFDIPFTTNVTCNGENNGVGSLSPSGGTSPYTYSWSNGVTTSVIRNLSAGTYSLTVRDANGCIVTGNAVITQPAVLAANTTVLAQACRSGAGSAQSSPTGGTSPYLYSWSNTANSSSIGGLSAGTYSVVVTDFNNCSVTGSVTIGSSNNTIIVNQSVISNVTCVGGNNGGAIASPTGGASPYTYSWSNGATTAMISNLSAGSYTITVEDAGGCQDINGVIITQPLVPLQVHPAVTSPTCYGNSGVIDAFPSDGYLPYTYLWSNGATTSNISNLSAGTYSITVTDNQGCIASGSATVTNLAGTPLNYSASATFSYATSIQSWTVPAGITQITVTARGGAGGASNSYSGWNNNNGIRYSGGNGGIISGVVSVTPGDILRIATGGAGIGTVSPSAQYAGSGGGGTFIWDQTNANTLLAVAGGGGGANQVNNGNNASTTINTNPGSGGGTGMGGGSIRDPGPYTGGGGAGFLGNGATFTSGNVGGGGRDMANGFTGGIAGDYFNDNPGGFGGGGGGGEFDGGGGGGYNGGAAGDENSNSAGGGGGSYLNGTITSASATNTGNGSLVISYNALFTTNLNCNGANNGSASATFSGGTSPYTYSWSNGQTGTSASNLSAGNYTVTVKDQTGCSVTASVTITQPNAISPFTVFSNISCNGANDGVIVVKSISGGTSPYTYLWNNGGTTNSINNLSPGTYTLTIRDNVGCTQTSSITITQPAQLSITSVATNIPCNGGTGSVTSTTSGGTSPYTYLWSDGETISNISALSVGTYSVSVTDSNGCTATASSTITQPALPLQSNVSIISNITCGNNSGSATSTTTGGTSPYTYLWSVGGGTKSSATGLSAGTYTLMVKDHNGCFVTTSATIVNTGLVIPAPVVTNASCSGNNGSATENFSSISVPFSYTGGLQSFTVPDYVTTATITVNGAAGGNVPSYGRGGNGTSFIGICTVSPGNTIGISVGGQPVSGIYYGAGGGGGTFVFDVATSTPLAIAAGGGGGGLENGGPAGDIVTSPYPTRDAQNGNAADGTGGNGGSGGNCSSLDGVGGGGGTGWFSNGTGGSICISAYSNTGGFNATNNFAGGTTSGYPGNAGGYGGGGAGGYAGGGGGGGYNGGGGGNNIGIDGYSSGGAGGGSYLNGVLSGAVTASNGGNGSATIQYNSGGGKSPYTYSWSGGGTNSTATGLSAGTYTLTVTDNTGCSATVAAIINQTATSLTASASVITNVGCNGSNSGNGKVNASGGTSPYTYSWSNGITNSTISNLSAGTYSVSVNDNSGCSATAGISISQPNALSGSASVISNVSTYGGSDGSATLTTSGGTSPYTYSWSNSSTTLTTSGLLAGTYTVTVQDNCGASVTASVTITQPNNPLAITILSSTNVLCNGNSTGGVTANIAIGGASPYTYSWSPTGGNNLTAANLSAGNYTITVTDANSSVATASVVISQPTQINVNASVVGNEICNGGSTGSGKVNTSGGTSPYIYTWSNGATSSIVSSLSAGTYSVMVTDNSGCSATANISITQPNSLSANAVVITNVSTNGGSDGSATLTTSGGTSPYTYSWSNGASTQNISSVRAGIYTIAIQDNCGATVTASVTITQPNNPLAITILSYTNILCNGNFTGSATANTAIGGASPYTYSWSPSGGNNLTASNLSAGNYTITVTDANSSVATASVAITQPNLALGVTSASANVLCNGGTGSASVTASGGTSPYTYSWSGGGTTSSINKTAGTYSVTVTDANLCSTTSSITITQPTQINASASVSANVLCNGGTGSASVTVSGGTSPYTYSWSGGGTTSSVNKIAGNYTVTVTDNNGCTATSIVSITQPLSLSANANVSANVLCNGGTGSASVTASGGTSPYTYLWSGGGTTSSVNKIAGNYTVTVTDNNGCAATSIVSITQPLSLSANANVSANVLCNGGTGSASVTANGGTSPYTYSWSGGGTTSSINKTAGTYSITVTDKHGCSASSSVTITQPTAIALSSNIVNVSYCSNNNGSATITATGGTSPYTYKWGSNAGNKTTATVTGLTAGNYTVTVTDAHGCSKTTSVVLTKASAITASIAVSNIKCLGSNNGSATLTAGGGTSPYTYKWSNALTTSTISGLTAGTYTVKITDAAGCSLTASTSITQPATSLSASISNIINVSCNGSNNGSARGNASGGTSPYTYSWSNGRTSSTPTGLSVGTYSLNVTDKNGCTAIAIVSITQPTAITITTTKTNVTTHNGTNGKATASASGGTSPYAYRWSNSKTTTSISGLSAGTYTITVTDKNECTATTNIIITQPQHSPEKPGNDDSLTVCCPGMENVNLYPNPNSGRFTIDGLEAGETYTIYDYTGRLINDVRIDNNSMQLNISNQPNGVYLIRIISKDGVLVSQKKVVKTN